MRLPPELVIATTNPGKFQDWQALLAPLGVRAIRPSDLPELLESETDLEENAHRKAVAAVRRLASPVIADDMGVQIERLGGGPGALLKRWAMSLGGWQAAQRFAGTLEGSRALYCCAVCLALSPERTVTTLGVVAGEIVRPRGTGPGLEPCFLPDGAPAVLSEPTAAHDLHPRAQALTLLTSMRPP